MNLFNRIRAAELRIAGRKPPEPSPLEAVARRFVDVYEDSLARCAARERAAWRAGVSIPNQMRQSSRLREALRGDGDWPQAVLAIAAENEDETTIAAWQAHLDGTADNPPDSQPPTWPAEGTAESTESAGQRADGEMAAGRAQPHMVGDPAPASEFSAPAGEAAVTGAPSTLPPSAPAAASRPAPRPWLPSWNSGRGPLRGVWGDK